MKKSGEGEQGKAALLKEQCERWKALNESISVVFQSLNLGDVLNAAIDGAIAFFQDTTGVEIHLLDGKKKTLFIKAHRGLPPWLIETGTFQVGEGLAGRVAQSGDFLCVEALSEDPCIDTKKIRKKD